MRRWISASAFAVSPWRNRPSCPRRTIRQAGRTSVSRPSTRISPNAILRASVVQAECIKLNGAMELAPTLGLCRRIVDLVSTGSTLKANGLVEMEHIADITSRLIVNRTALKTRPVEIQG